MLLGAFNFSDLSSEYSKAPGYSERFGVALMIGRDQELGRRVSRSLSLREHWSHASRRRAMDSLIVFGGQAHMGELAILDLLS